MAILTISRQYGSGGLEVGRAVAAALSYELADKERLLEDMRASGEDWARLELELDEAAPTLWERHDWQYHAYLALLESLIWEYARGGRAVIVGRGAGFILAQAPACLRVCLTAPWDLRVQRIMERQGLAERDQAERLIKQIDQERSAYIRSNYHRAWDDPAGYDLRLDSGQQTIAEITQHLVGLLEEKERLTTAEDRRALEGMALAARLKARLAGERRLLTPTLEVLYTLGGLVVRGVIHQPREGELIEEISRQVCGQTPWRLELRPRA